MKGLSYIFTAFVLVMMLMSVATAAPFQILKSTKIAQPVEQLASENIVKETAVQAEPVRELVRATEVYKKLDISDEPAEPAESISKLPSFEVVRKYDDLQVFQPSDDGDNDSGDSGFSINRQAMTIHDMFWWDRLNEASTELHIESKEVSGSTTQDSTFTITVTATDSDDMVTRISLGVDPYSGADYDIRDCDPAAHSCTEAFELSESEPGIYYYRIKAKNERNQIVNGGVYVTITPVDYASSFNFRTAALDGEDYSIGITDYIDSEITMWADEIAGVTLSGTPFATFSVPSNVRMAAEYVSPGYTSDTDYFLFDSRLPGCAGSSCELVRTIDDADYTTSCSLVLSDFHYFCTMSDDDGYSIAFDYRATSDPVGPNTIRRYNHMYPTSAPIVNFGEVDVSFTEGGSYILALDDYVLDEDTAMSGLTWTVEDADNVAVIIDPDSPHDAVITTIDPSWIGHDIIRFRVTDPEGNTGSDLITVRVIPAPDENDAPVIVSKTPDSDTVTVGFGSSREFSIVAMDPDYDLITITWRKGADVVATNTFVYVYEDTDGVEHPLTVVVSDGTEEDAAAWDISLVEPIGDIEGTVTDSDTSALLSGVIVGLLEPGTDTVVDTTTTDGSGHYSMTGIWEGAYDLRFAKSSYDTLTFSDVMIVAGETTVQDAEMDITPPQIGTLQGTVRDDVTSSPIGGVLVEALIAGVPVNSTTTAPSGSYSMQIASGTYTVRFTKLGYEMHEASGISITTGGTTTVNANLVEATDPIGTIQGTVTRSSGGALSGALVEMLLPGDVFVNSTLTSGTGNYNMKVLAGTYNMRVSKAGYSTKTVSGITVSGGSTTTRSFVMDPWWDDTYQVKYPIDISAAGSISSTTQFPLKLVFNSSNIDYSDFQSNGGDVRFVDSTGSSELDYFVEVWNDAGTSIVYVEVPISPSSTNTVYLYGDSSVVQTTTSNFANTFGSNLNMFQSANDGASDLSGHGYHGTVSGATHIVDPALDVEGVYGDYDFDGSNDKISYSISALSIGSSSMCMRFKYDSIGEAFLYDSWDGANTQIRLNIDTSNHLHINYYEGSNCNNGAGTTSVADGLWHHVCVVDDLSSDTSTIWLDGDVEHSESNTCSSYGPGGVVNQGTSWVDSSHFEGQMDEFRIYNGVLSSNDVKLLASQPIYSVGASVSS